MLLVVVRLTLTERQTAVDLESAPGGVDAADEMTEALEELNAIVLDVLTAHVLEALKTSKGYMRVVAGEADKAKGDGKRAAAAGGRETGEEEEGQ